MGIKIGKFRHRLILQEYTETQNTYGEPEKTWTNINTLWCSVEPLLGKEYMASKEIQSEVSTKVRLRYHPNITPKMRFYGGERYFEIVSVQNVQYGPSKNETICMCREILT